MSPEPLLAARSPSELQAAADFKEWVYRLVKGAAEIQAFEAGQIDAVVDPTTGRAILAPEAQAALQSSNGLVLSALDALPGEVCVLDSAATVVMTNKAWRAFVAARAGAGLGVCAGANFLTACRDAGASERVHAKAVAAGLRQVLAGERELFRRAYACRSAGGHCAFTLTIAGVAADGAVHAVITRENVRERRRAGTLRGPGRTMKKRIATLARAGAANRLLAALPTKDYARLLSGLEPVTLTYGEVLHEPGNAIEHVYFPLDCLVSLLTIVEGRQALEVALVGREGIVGSRLAFGIAVSSVRAVVQGTGTALRVESARFLQELRRSPALQQALFDFTDMLMSQITQTAACNTFHVLEARLARWLLMTRERLSSGEFSLTQNFLADMLGVRRVGVSVAAGALRRRKLIHYQRGHITILDQQGLEAASCSCYRSAKSWASKPQRELQASPGLEAGRENRRIKAPK
jgi:CRP-like cAMP-binding protein